MSVRLSNWHDKKLTPVFEDLRAKDSALEAQDAQLARVDAALQAQLDAKFLQLQNTLTGNMNTLYTRMLPIGSVIMWGLPLEQKPANFVVCDGTWHVINGVNQQVPDLRGRFALGVCGSYGFKSVGGEYNVTLNENQMPSHTHGIIIHDAGEHKHEQVSHAANDKVKGSSNHNFMWPNKDWGDFTKPAGNHNHSATVYHAGGNQAHNNMPPYFSLYYLIKIAN
jgi:microcystin-dependent protein